MAEITVQGFDVVDSENIQRIKDTMAEKAIAGDAAAALAYSHLLSNETARTQLLVTAAGIEMGEGPVAAAPSWADRVIDGGKPVAEMLTVAA